MSTWLLVLCVFSAGFVAGCAWSAAAVRHELDIRPAMKRKP